MNEIVKIRHKVSVKGLSCELVAIPGYTVLEWVARVGAYFESLSEATRNLSKYRARQETG